MDYIVVKYGYYDGIAIPLKQDPVGTIGGIKLVEISVDYNGKLEAVKVKSELNASYIVDSLNFDKRFVTSTTAEE